MGEPGKDSELEQLLSRLGEEFAAGGSITPNVQARLTGVQIQTPRNRLGYAAVAAVLLVGVGLWYGREDSTPIPQTRPQRTEAGMSVHTECVLGNAIVIQHVAAVVDRRAVLVIWSCRDADVTDGDQAAPDYRQHVLAREQTGDGWSVVWSLFVAEGKVTPALDPPAIHVRTSDGRMLLLSVSPGTGSRKEIADALRTADLPGRSRISLADIEWMIQGI